MKKNWVIWLVVFAVILMIGIYISAKRGRVAEKKVISPEILQKKSSAKTPVRPGIRKTKTKKHTASSRKKFVLPPNYEPVSPEKKGIESFEEERRQQKNLKNRGTPTG